MTVIERLIKGFEVKARWDRAIARIAAVEGVCFSGLIAILSSLPAEQRLNVAASFFICTETFAFAVFLLSLNNDRLANEIRAELEESLKKS